jgi:type IV secretion system protein VirB1
MDFIALAQQCAPTVHPQTMAAVVHVESSFNPYAIGVVGGQLERQPRNKAEAVATAKALEAAGYNFSLGVGQVNRYNLAKYKLDYDKAFDACESLRAGSAILTECFERAQRRFGNEQQALQAAFSCYYSGNFSTGFKPDFKGQPSYVQKILNSAASVSSSGTVPPIAVIPNAKAKTVPVAKAPAGVVRLTVEGQGAAQPARTSDVYANTERNVLVY